MQDLIMTLDIFMFPCLSDNYGVLVHDPLSGRTAAIDVPDAAAVLDALDRKGWRLTDILTTHHHADHVQGNLEVKAATGCTITGPAGEAGKIPGIDVEVREGDEIDFAGHPIRVIETPGHTLGHIAYHFPMDDVAFVGDTLFALGCGRVLEGTLEQMWGSVEKVGALPSDTVLYCGHEYTLSNAKFALTVDPDNEKLKARAARIETLRAEDKATLPTTIGEELETNPFLRWDDPSIRKHLGMEKATDAEVFAEIRKRKDNF